MTPTISVQPYKDAAVSTKINHSELDMYAWIDATDVHVSMVLGSALLMKTIALIVRELVVNGVVIPQPVRLLTALLCLTALRKSVFVQVKKFGMNIKNNVWK